MSTPREQQVLAIIESVLRQSGVRRRLYVDGDVYMALAEGLQEHGIPAAAVSRRCLLSCRDGASAMSSPENIPALMLGDQPISQRGAAGWPAVLKEFCSRKSRGKFYGDKKWDAQWKDNLVPLKPGAMHQAIRELLLPALRQSLVDLHAKDLDAAVAPAQAPCRRPRF